CALRRRLGENRRLDLEIPALIEKSTRRLLESVPQNEVLLQLGATQIEIAMLQPQLFGGKLLTLSARNWNGGRLRRPDDLELASPYFDISGLHLLVAHLERPSGNFTFDRDYGLRTVIPRPLQNIDG